MIRPLSRFAVIAVALSLISVAAAEATPVSYAAHLRTSLGNPVTDVILIESDGTQVKATVHPSSLPGNGPAVIMHESPLTPTQALVIGLTEGLDENSNPKTQIVMFLNPSFAAAHAGVPFSSVFPGAKHSLTITAIQEAVAGDANQLAWFADTFFSGPAAGASFTPGGSFVVAEFTALNIIGASAASGNWMINSFQALNANDPNAQSFLPTGIIDETAKVDVGPFDIAVQVDDDGRLAIVKTVLNNSGVDWRSFEMRLGTGSGANFVASTTGDGLSFETGLNNTETTGAFPTVIEGEDRLRFEGFLPVGESATFVVFINTNTNGLHTITIRQIAAAQIASPAPAAGTTSLALLAVGLLLAAGSTLRAQRRRQLGESR